MAEAVGIVNIKLKASTATLKTGLRSSVNDMRQWSTQAQGVFNATRTPLEKYKAEVAKLTAMYKKGLIDTNTFGRAQVQLRQQYMQSTGALQAKAAAERQAAIAAKEHKRQMDRMLATPSKVQGVMTSLASMAGGYMAIHGAIRVLQGGLQRTEGLSRSMNRSLAIMGDVSGQTRGAMRTEAIRVERDTIFNAREAADAYFFLASAGLNAEQSLASMSTVAKFGQAGNFDLARATDLLTDAQSALGLTVKDTAQNLRNMNRVGDVFVKANAMANASVEQFSEALTTKAGAALRIVNKDIEEGVAVLAVFADQGLKGSDAGTAFSIVMRDLQTKSIKNADAFKKAGIAVYDQSGKMRHLADIIGDLEKSMDGMSDREAKATLLMLGFSDKSVAFTQQLIGSSEAIRENDRALRDASGTMDEVANKQMTELEKATNRWNAALTTLSERLSGSISMMARFKNAHAELIERLNQGQSPIGGTLPGTNFNIFDPMNVGALLKARNSGTFAQLEAIRERKRKEYEEDVVKPQVEAENTRKKLEEEETLKRLDELKKEADKIKEGLRSPAEIIEEARARMQEMVDAINPKTGEGFLTPGEMAQRLDEMRQRLMKPSAAMREAERSKMERDRRKSALTATVATPLENFRDKLNEYADLFGTGSETYERLKEALKDKTVEDMMSDIRKSTAGTISGASLTAGSSGAQSFLAKLQADKVNALNDPAQRERIRSRKLLEEIEAKPPVVEVSTEPI